MPKLYPPELEGTLPAFTKVTSVEIPFVRNKTVSHNNGVITKMKLLIKNIYGTRIFGTFESVALNLEEDTALFNLYNIRSQLSVGQFYKVQIAYVGQNDEVGYYSNVGVIKYTALPTLTLNLNLEEYNLPKVDYIGTYTNNEDPTEKAYSYQFIIKDSNNIIIADSKINIHNHDNNTGYIIQYLNFNPDNLSNDEIHRKFRQALMSDNALIRLTAVDIVKYAYMIEHNTFRSKNVSRSIGNAALNSYYDGGLSIGTFAQSAMEQFKHNLSTIKNERTTYKNPLIRTTNKNLFIKER